MVGNDEIQRAAEQFLDEMLDAEEKLDYQLFVKRFEKKDVDNFGESRFTKDMYAIRTDLGAYQSRKFLGALNGYEDADNAGRHPGCIRYVWRGIFEKNETLMIMGIHAKDGIFYVNEFMYHH
jgi:hypothetical protein